MPFARESRQFFEFTLEFVADRDFYRLFLLAFLWNCSPMKSEFNTRKSSLPFETACLIFSMFSLLPMN